MYPELFVIPIPFSDMEISVYTVYFSITLALVICIYYGTGAARKEGLDTETALNMILTGLVTLMLGARIYVFLADPSFYLSNPAEIIKIWEGGLATYGGAIGGVMGCIGYLVIKKRPMKPYLDVYAPYGILGIGIIRAGDFFNGTAFGIRTGLPWGVSFPRGSFAYNQHLDLGWIMPDATASLTVHPAQLYSAIACLIIFLVLVYGTSILRKFPGNLFLAGSSMYVIARFIVDYFRADLKKDLFLNLASTQWVGIVVLCICISVWIFLFKRSNEEAESS